MDKTKKILREVLVICLSILISFILTEPQQDLGGDASRYLNMTEGLTEEMPWSARILIPRIIGFLFVGDYPIIWYCWNVVIFGLALYVFSQMIVK